MRLCGLVLCCLVSVASTWESSNVCIAPQVFHQPGDYEGESSLGTVL